MQAFSFKSKMRLLFLRLVLFILIVCLCETALAEAPIHLHDIGLRYYADPEELCVTRHDLPEEALGLFGMDQSTLLSAMESGRIHFISISPEGRQVSLRILDKPDGIVAENDFQLGAQEQELFLRKSPLGSHFSPLSWDTGMPGFAVFSTDDSESATDNGVHSVAIARLYRNRIYVFQMDIFGRAQTAADSKSLWAVYEKALFLGAAEGADSPPAEAAVLALPAPAPVTEYADFTETIGSIPLTLVPLPKVLGTTTFLLEGTTAPDAFIRYIINGAASSRVKPAPDGSFAISAKGLDDGKTNEVEVTASRKGDEMSSIRFDMPVDWQPTPLALSPLGGDVYEDRTTVNGLTLPGAKVQLFRKTGTANIVVQKDGSFTFDVVTKRDGKNTFAVRALSNGYRRTDIELAFTRKSGDSDNPETLWSKAKPVSYEDLIANPVKFKGQTVPFEGTVSDLANEDGRPCFLLSIADGSSILCYCQNLLQIETGQGLRVLGTLTGESASMRMSSGNEAYPALEVSLILP